ncbi:SMC-Scp complex subunit ScpB [Pectinatus brassicae]|uniref:Segregation and condensation protein B n=1 Tax=Pectinatus brassicae TaxID=862415 RepID=A0A840UHY0_9FIRM|nr:SMC-Scp complex subunit ScpB [Pectinatus brassicae]MBB5336726.1 segregation and condensation protein B [Pectinatus brassicae]
MFYEKLKAPLEAMLFVNGNPLPINQIIEILGIDKENVEMLVNELQDDMIKANRGLMIKKIADSYQMCTKPQVSGYLERLTEITDKKLSAPALETLSIIAFKQPITKQEIENIRGVRADSIINKLLERNLIQEVGRKKVVGRPILYGTTNIFLQCFGLSDLSDLPALPL